MNHKRHVQRSTKPTHSRGWASVCVSNFARQRYTALAMIPSANNDKSPLKWFHVTFSTYGSWLPGDPRGFRTRDHREHVEGDYKNPPPAGQVEGLRQRSHARLKRPMVRLTPQQRACAGRAMVEMLRRLEMTVVAIAVGAQHVHIVVQLPDDDAKLVVGRAKKHAAHVLIEDGFRGGPWAKGCRTQPIVDQAHQHSAISYVARHKDQGAWAWRWGDPDPL